MKNSLNISVAGEDLISTVDDSTNRLFINGTEVPSTSWTGSGTYSTTVQGHAITVTQVEDTTGNVAIRRTAAYTYELYKINTGTTIDGDLIVTGSISEGGTKLEDKYGRVPVYYTTSLTTTGSEAMEKSWTVRGSGGYINVSVSAYTDLTNDYGTTWAQVQLNGTDVAVEQHRLNATWATMLAANASVMIPVSDGDTITVRGGSTKSGTKTLMGHVMAFGCTLS